MYTELAPAEVVNGSRCSACSAGALCAISGPIPDFEFGLAAALFHLR
ncbi:subtilosin A family bacteriocin [Corynebacterium freiburgense]|nr:subtilosin A family bacteriocin [Corynebacterium freiburgense]WJZ03426.1 Subtilosin-A precursor [Corynebacterium freiburgense]